MELLCDRHQVRLKFNLWVVRKRCSASIQADQIRRCATILRRLKTSYIRLAWSIWRRLCQFKRNESKLQNTISIMKKGEALQLLENCQRKISLQRQLILFRQWKENVRILLVTHSLCMRLLPRLLQLR